MLMVFVLPCSGNFWFICDTKLTVIFFNFTRKLSHKAEVRLLVYIVYCVCGIVSFLRWFTSMQLACQPMSDVCLPLRRR